MLFVFKPILSLFLFISKHFIPIIHELCVKQGNKISEIKAHKLICLNIKIIKIPSDFMGCQPR